MKMKFKDWDCIVQGRFYGNGRKAIELVSDDDMREPIATASVNMVDAPCANDQVWVKNYSENEGMVDALNKAGIIENKPISVIPTGFVLIPLYNLTDKAMEELWDQKK